jgi:hypothetical protein
METRSVVVDRGDGQVTIRVPGSAAVVEYRAPASSPPEPSVVVRDALLSPRGLDPLRARAHPGARITVAFDDPLRSPPTVRTAFPVVLEELSRCGVGPKALTLISANGAHGRFSFQEFRDYLSPAVADAFGPDRILNHDCADEKNLVRLGTTRFGGPVEPHRAAVESDLLIYIGNMAPNVWGGCGGMGAVVGLGSAASIRHHHGRAVIGAPDSCHGDQRRMLYQQHKEAVAWEMDKAAGRSIFYLECLTDGTRVLEAFAGHFGAIRDPGWEAADRHFDVPSCQADVLVVGLPRKLLYGDTHNPLIALTGLNFAARMWKGTHILKEGGVAIAVTDSRGVIDPERHPSYDEIIRLYAEGRSVEALPGHEEHYVAHRGHVASYRHGRGFHPLHPFWLLYEDEYLLNRARRIVFAGGQDSPITRRLGIEVATDFEAAWAMAREIVGPEPQVVVAPTYWSRPRIKFVVRG